MADKNTVSSNTTGKLLHLREAVTRGKEIVDLKLNNGEISPTKAAQWKRNLEAKYEPTIRELASVMVRIEGTPDPKDHAFMQDWRTMIDAVK